MPPPDRGSRPRSFTTGSVLSRDGTRIGFRREGSGPGLVLVQGAMQTAEQYAGLAHALAPSFTVLSPDRRGRGASPRVYDAGHSIERDVEDLDAVLDAASATRVFGLSSGGVITLEAARVLDRVERVVVYEPPFYASGIDRAGIARLGRQVERDDLAAALVSSLRVAGTLPAALAALPGPLARLVARVVLAVDDRTHEPSASLRELLPGVRYDFAAVGEVDGRIEQYAAVDVPVLLLSGTRSPAFLREATQRLRTILPRAEHEELAGLGHDGPWGRSPDQVADAVARFLR